jgi:hypothetical protein
MSQTRLELRETLNVLLSDMKDQKWTATQKNHFLNQALQDIISSESIPYVRVAELPIRDGEYEYEFPEDMLEPVAMMFQSIEGSIIISSSWRSLMVNYDIENSLTSFDTSVFWQEAANASGHVTIRDIVSDNKFIFSPKYQADLYDYTVHRQDNLPDSASEQSVWVDTYADEQYVYQCDETYDASASQASITLDSDYLAGDVDLLMTYDTAGIKYVQVVMVNGGASGTTAVTIDGDADDRANPLTYTFTVYDDEATNDHIIATAHTGLTLTGADATTGTIVDTSIELENPAAAKWTQQVLHLRYLAIFTKLATDEDELPAELPVLMREGDCIPYIAGYKLLDAVKGDERSLIMARTFKSRAQDIIDRCHMHRAGNGPPYDVEPS